MPSSHWNWRNMLPIQITDSWRKQLLTSFIKCLRFTVSFIISYVLSANRSWLLATFLALHHRRCTRRWQHMQLWSSLAIGPRPPFWCKIVSAKGWTLDLGKLIAREPINLDLLASSLLLFPFVVYIIPHRNGNVNSFFLVFLTILHSLNKWKKKEAFAFDYYVYTW